ncbi:MAG: hypothetical protein PHY46_03720 [Candidatus Omnitrophica bacterium]|nr:hypothetical protein [Candidatus Omnitrophota bacterium]MDD5355362.1 hypothetical protein [Candidatus Omnitrophota bacterium]
MDIKNHFLATGIGSLPFTDLEKALDFVLDNFSAHIPFWPQLPRKSFLESMHVQFSQGFPGVKIDLSRKNVYIDTQGNSFMEEFEECYDALNNKRQDFFSVSPDYAAGLDGFLKNIKNKNSNFIKGQVIGPISYGMTLLDEKKRPLIFNKELSEIIPQFLGLKAKWQIKEFKKAAKSGIVMFIDEPYLVAIGTNQFAGLDGTKISSQLNSVINEIHQENALAGIHCCGNTDWSIILGTDIDILSFDAFGFMDNLLIYKDSLDKFIKRGGVLAFGIVPNRQDYNLEGYAQSALKIIKNEPWLLKNGAIITPSCGCGTLSEDLAKRIHLLTIEIADKLAALQKR